MVDYSIGDRVEVRWEAELFAAAVVHVHSVGKVDAVYGIDGSVGIFLTAKKHGLKLLGDEKRREEGGRRKRCSWWMAARTKSMQRNFALHTVRRSPAP